MREKESKMKRILPWLVGFVAVLLRATCRLRIHNDPRPKLRAQGVNYVYALLHAHQLGGILDAERGTGTMVSRSDDGDVVVPALRVCGLTPIRGSGGQSRKGGVRALLELIKYVSAGHPAALTVDGPMGPRGCVHEGVVLLSKKTGAAMLPLIVVPSRRWVIKKAWDRLQFPMPFATIHHHYGDPIFPSDTESKADFAQRIELELKRLELKHDGSEATLAGVTVGSPESASQRRAAA